MRVARTEREGRLRRGQSAGASIVSTASLEALRRASGATRQVDARRFRMTIGIDTEEPHVEDTWIGSRVRVGGAVVLVATTSVAARSRRAIPTPACATSTLSTRSLTTGRVPTGEPLPFGVWGEVVAPGRVASGDRVETCRSGRKSARAYQSRPDHSATKGGTVTSTETGLGIEAKSDAIYELVEEGSRSSARRPASRSRRGRSGTRRTTTSSSPTCPATCAGSTRRTARSSR